MTDKKTKNAKKRSKTVVKKPKVIADDARLRKKPEYKSFRLQKSIKYPGPGIPSAGALAKKAFKLMRANAKPLGWFFLGYGLLSVVFVTGLVSALDANLIKEQIDENADGLTGFSRNIATLGVIMSSSFRASGEVSSIYQMVFFFTSILALIWLFRQQQAGLTVSIKDAFYRGMYPLVPFFLIVVVAGFQTLPAVIGNTMYTIVVSGGLAVTFIEQLFWFLFLLLFILLSLYMVSATLIALFVVTLPEMTPRVALREAKKMVTHRRLAVLLRVIALLIFICIAYVGIIFPTIFVSPALAQLFYFALTILILPSVTAYLFVLYRELL